MRTWRQGRKKAATGGPGAAWGSPGQSWRRLLLLVVLCRRRSLSAAPCNPACRLPAPRGLSPSFPPAPPARAPARHRPAQPPPLPPARRTSWLEIPADAPAARRAARAGRGGEGAGERLPPTLPLATKSLSRGQAPPLGRNRGNTRVLSSQGRYRRRQSNPVLAHVPWPTAAFATPLWRRA